MAGHSIAAKLGGFAQACRIEDVPSESLERARILVLDAIGNAYASYETPPCRLARRYAEVLQTAGGPSTVWIAGYRARAMDAVLANSVFVHGLLGDDQQQGTRAHPESILIPTALAVAEQEGRSGAEALMAIVLGYEVTGRLGAKFKFAGPSQGRGFRQSPLIGTVGAASVASRLLGLSEAEYATALAVAASFTCGLVEPTFAGGWEWRFQNGVAARNGILAAELARRGLVGAPTAFEGSHGFFRAFGGLDEPPEEVTADLGRSFYIDNVTLKPIPSDGNNQVPGVITQRLVKEYRITPEQIERIKLVVIQRAVDHTSTQFPGPFTTAEQALFAMRFAIAAIVCDGELTGASYRDVSRNDIAEVTAKIEVESCGHPKEFPDFLNAAVEIHLRDGAVIKGGRELVDLDQFYPNAQAARAKFLRLTRDRLPATRGEAICGLVLDRFNELQDLHDLTRLLT